MTKHLRLILKCPGEDDFVLNEQNQLSFDDEGKPMSALSLLIKEEIDRVFIEFLRFARIQRDAVVNNT
jgi:hypothetical protein